MTIIITVLIFVICIVALWLFTGSVILFDVIRDHVTWREATQPLDQVIIDDLCYKLEIDPTDPRCENNGAPVYGPDFYRDLYDMFTPHSQLWATYDKVEEKIGTYKYKCEPAVQLQDGTEYFRCFYDFADDKVFPIVVFYYSNGDIMELIADVSD
jgi:hypothetical protein